jgi:hypothetical protein
MSVPSPDDVVLDEFLGEQPRAETWRVLRETLEARLTDALAERGRGDTSAALERRIRELREQIAALAQEEAVTRFVEDSVRATLARPEPLVWDDEDDAGGPY